jgi:hypothetical protein
VLRIAEEEVVVVHATSGGRHSGLHLHPLRVLSLALVRVLVASKRLRRREVPAAVVALELAAAVGGDSDGTATAALCGSSDGGFFGLADLCRRMWDIDAKDANTTGVGAFTGRLGAQERKL